MRTNAMGTSRGPIARDAKPAGVKAGINNTTSSSRPLWDLLAEPTKQAKFRWFCLEARAREAIACAFLDEFAVVCRDADSETSLTVALDVVELAKDFPNSELSAMADGLMPTIKQLAFRCDVATIVTEAMNGWTPQSIPLPAAPAPAALHASA